MSGLYFFLPKGTAVTVFYEVRGLLMSALQDLIKKYTSIIVVDSPEGMPSSPPTDGVYWYIKDPDVYRRVLVQGDLGLGESRQATQSSYSTTLVLDDAGQRLVFQDGFL